jgi:hypothetical protein
VSQRRIGLRFLIQAIWSGARLLFWKGKSVILSSSGLIIKRKRKREERKKKEREGKEGEKEKRKRRKREWEWEERFKSLSVITIKCGQIDFSMIYTSHTYL